MEHPPEFTTFRSLARSQGIQITNPLPQYWPLEQWFASAVDTPLAFIAIQAFALTLVGLSLGQRVGQRVGERAELAPGVVLTLLGVAVAVEQWTGNHFL